MPAPNPIYYSRVDQRLPVTARISRGCSKNGILIDGEGRGRGRLHEGAAAAFRQDRDRPDLLRVHPAQGRRRLRRRELQGAVRVDRGRSDPRRRVEGREVAMAWKPMSRVTPRRVRAGRRDGRVDCRRGAPGAVSPRGRMFATSDACPHQGAIAARRAASSRATSSARCTSRCSTSAPATPTARSPRSRCRTIHQSRRRCDYVDLPVQRRACHERRASDHGERRPAPDR